MCREGDIRDRRGDETRRVGGASDATPGVAVASRGHGSDKSPTGDSSPRRISGSRRRRFARPRNLAGRRIARSAIACGASHLRLKALATLLPHYGNINSRPSRDGPRRSQPFGLSPSAKTRIPPWRDTNKPALQASRIAMGSFALYSDFWGLSPRLFMYFVAQSHLLPEQ